MAALVLACVFAFVALLGFLGLIAVTCFWKRTEPWYQSGLPKIFVTAAQVFSGFSGIFSGTLGTWPSDKSGTEWVSAFFAEPWNRALLAAVTSWLAWEILQAVAEWRSRRALEQARNLERQVYVRIALLATLRRLVNEKRRQIGEALHDGKPLNHTIQFVRKGLKPREHVQHLIESMATFFSSLHRVPNSTDAAGQNFRIGLYVENNGVLEPFEAFDLNQRFERPFQSYEENRERFRLDNRINPSEAVNCIRQRRLLIFTDCGDPSHEGGLEYFNEEQAIYLKSMVAYPILDFRDGDGRIKEAALLVDTDESGFFREDDRDIIQAFMDNFADRLNLELHILTLLGE